MSYKNLTNIDCADKEEFFQRLRDFLCAQDATDGTYDYSTTGIGWTMHDEVYATDKDNCALNDYFVIYSPGEGGDDDIYIKVTWTSGYILFYGYLSWDASTHAGSTRRYNTDSIGTVPETGGTYILWIYGDLDEILYVHDLMATDCYGANAGKLAPAWDYQDGEDVATCSSALSSGSDVSIVVDAAPADWEIGTELYIRTTHNNAMGTTYIEKIEIKTISTNTITADLTNSYTADSKLSRFVGYGCQATTQIHATRDVLISDSESYDAPNTGVYLNLTTANFDPGPNEDKFYLLEYFYHSATGLAGKLRHIRRVPTFVSGFAIGDILQLDDDTEYRCFQAYSGVPLAVKEV